MAGCGTVAGYHAHVRRKEETCADCRAAMAEDKREQRANARARAASSMAEAIETEPDLEPGLDPLELARWNARLVKAAMRNASPRDMAANSKRLEELGDLIARLEAETNKATKEVSRIDQLARRREERRSKTAN